MAVPKNGPKQKARRRLKRRRQHMAHKIAVYPKLSVRGQHERGLAG